MKLTFRMTIMSALLLVLAVTVSVVAVSSYNSAQFTARELSRVVLNRTADRIDAEIGALCDRANRALNLELDFLDELQASRTAALTKHDFPAITKALHDDIRVFPDLDAIYLGLAASGDYCHATWLDGDRISVQDTIRQPDGDIERRDYTFRDGRRLLYHTEPDCGYDPRERPWYQAVEAAGGPTWTESYTFASGLTPGAQAELGVTLAAPFNDAAGKRVGVAAVDITLGELSRFISQLQIGYNGFAFVVELDGHGTQRLLAHPEASKVLRAVGDRQERVSITALNDPVLLSFLSRPEIGQAEEGRVVDTQFEVDGQRYLAAYERLSRRLAPPWCIGVLIPEEALLRRIRLNNDLTVAIGGFGVLVGIFISILVAGAVSRPLRQIAEQTRAVAELRLEPTRIEHSMVLEVDRLATAMEQMKTGLRSFEKFVPADLVRQVLASGRDLGLEGEHRVVTITFSDIEGFTPIAEALDVDTLVNLLGDYLGALSQVIAEHQGTVDKYIGDAIMAFWGAPQELPDHRRLACLATLRQQQRLAELRPQWQAQGLPAVSARMGVHTGEVIVGTMGSEARLNYTLIGDQVNLASRLEGLNRYYRTGILASEATYRGLEDEFLWRRFDAVSVKGKTAAVRVAELVAVRTEAGPALLGLVERFDAAVERYEARDWVTAAAEFEALVAEFPDDYPSELYRARCEALRREPPGPDWDAVLHMETK